MAWIDLLSQMEYVGFRKIVKAVSFDRIDSQILRHMAEEASHAYLLSNILEQWGGTPWTGWAASPLSAAGFAYFSNLDACLCREVGGEKEGAAKPEQWFYPTVSWAVEQRVLDLYPAYLKTTREPLVQTTLRRILAQERKHSEEAEEKMPPVFQERALQIEHLHWSEFCDRILESDTR
jgi:hypothetical protein